MLRKCGPASERQMTFSSCLRVAGSGRVKQPEQRTSKEKFPRDCSKEPAVGCGCKRKGLPLRDDFFGQKNKKQITSSIKSLPVSESITGGGRGPGWHQTRTSEWPLNGLEQDEPRARQMASNAAAAAAGIGHISRAQLLFAFISALIVALQACSQLASSRPHNNNNNNNYRNQNFGPLTNGRQLPLDDHDRLALAATRGSQPDASLSYEAFNLDQHHIVGPLQESRQHYRPPMQLARAADLLQRRDDLEDELEDDDSDDQSAAASYQNQDNNDGPSAGGQTDGYGDNEPEPDAAYEETPNEQDGQADLERFFDDHLGASDRDGMDKENLPSNLIRALAPAGGRSNYYQQQQQQKLRLAPVTTHPRPVAAASDLSLLALATQAVPLSSVVNPQIEPAPSASFKQPMFEPTFETTRYIKLPYKNELVITHQMTRNRAVDTQGRQPMPLAPPLRDPPPTSENFGHANNGNNNAHELSATDNRSNNQEPEPRYGWEGRPASGGPAGQASSSFAHRDDSNADARKDGQHQQQQRTAASESEAVQVGEDDNFDRVFITNATNKPFRIAALGGYDPEQDFQDAAAEIDERNKASGDGSGSGGRARDRARRRQNDAGNDADSSSSEGENVSSTPANDVNFNDAETEQMFEDASETDEVTFGQDDPYQTDLEAEMRQQEFDKVGHFLAANPQYASHVLRDASELNHQHQHQHHQQQQQSRPMAVSASSGTKVAKAASQEQQQPRRQSRGEADETDEGSWAHDGVEDMDIPSQSHQNMILEKAAKQEEAARRAGAAVASGDGSSSSSGAGTQTLPDTDDASSAAEGEASTAINGVTDSPPPQQPSATKQRAKVNSSKRHKNTQLERRESNGGSMDELDDDLEDASDWAQALTASNKANAAGKANANGRRGSDAKRQAMALRAARRDRPEEAPTQPGGNDEAEEGQRMPNANYLESNSMEPFDDSGY